jgi:uncharacterized membrane protein YccF (DUF307 family)
VQYPHVVGECGWPYVALIVDQQQLHHQHDAIQIGGVLARSLVQKFLHIGWWMRRLHKNTAHATVARVTIMLAFREPLHFDPSTGSRCDTSGSEYCRMATE